MSEPWKAVGLLNSNIRRNALRLLTPYLCALRALEHKLNDHDEVIHDILNAIRQLMAPPDKPKRRIGFIQED